MGGQICVLLDTRCPPAVPRSFCRPIRKTRRWPKPANGSSKQHHLLELFVPDTKKLAEIKDTVKREAFLHAVAHGSAASGGHVNLLGKYDFVGRAAAGFNRNPAAKIHRLNRPSNWELRNAKNCLSIRRLRKNP